MFELRGGDHVTLPVGVNERRTIETHQQVVEHTGEGDLERGLALGDLLVEVEGGGVVLLVIGGFARAVGHGLRGEDGRPDDQVEGVQGDLGSGVGDVDVDLDATREGRGVEIGGQKDPIGARDDVTREAIGVRSRSHKHVA